MSSDYISQIKVCGDKARLETFCTAFKEEGFEHVKPYKTDMDKNALSAWRKTNWGVYYNLDDETQSCILTDDGEIHISILTTNNFPIKFLQHISAMYNFTITLSCSYILSQLFVYVKIKDGEILDSVRASYFSARAIDFYGEEEYKGDVMMFLEFYLDELNIKLGNDAQEEVYQQLLSVGIKEVITDNTLLKLEVDKMLEYNHIYREK